MVSLTIPVERIDAEARQLDPRRALLTIVLAVPFLLGWVARKTWMVLAWLWTAVLIGWQEAGRPRQGEAVPDE
ncbi:hypothetical protein [Streptosporangium canum]|uniref:hypothetical protein n=1 Tax=Streptosporangium canum TaxID=324952 RepID=UPI0037A720FD